MTKITVVRAGVRTVVAQVTGGAQVRVRGVGTQGVPGPASPKGFALEWPVNGEDVTMFYTPYAIRVADLHSVIVGTGSVAMRVVRGASRQVVDAVIAEATVDDANTGISLDVIDGAVPMGSYVWTEVVGVTGEVRELHTTLWF